MDMISLKRVKYSSKYGGDDVLVEIYNWEDMIGQVIHNTYLNKIRGVDLRLSDKNENDENAYFFSDINDTFEEQIQDAVINIIFKIGKNDLLF